jgi:hypothetical protein
MHTELCKQINYVWNFLETCCFHRCGKMKWNHFLKENMWFQRQFGCFGEQTFFTSATHYWNYSCIQSIAQLLPQLLTSQSSWNMKQVLSDTSGKRLCLLITCHLLFITLYILYFFIFLLSLPNKCLFFASEYTNRVHQCFNNSLLYFRSLQLVSAYKPFSRKSSQTHCYRFKVCKSMHHHTIQINHQLDAKFLQFIILLVVFGPAGPNTTNGTAITTIRR